MSKQLDGILGKRPEAVARPTAKPTPAAAKPAPPAQPAAVTDKDVSLGAMVPASVKRALDIRAASEGRTRRELVLLALREIGIEVPADALKDRRK